VPERSASTGLHNATDRDACGLRSVATLNTVSISAQIVMRADGEVLWRHPRHRIVLPLTGADVRNVTAQFEGGRTREFVWHNSLGFYPAATQARTVTTAATSLQLLWTPDPEITYDLEPLVPFDDAFIAINARMIAQEMGSGAPDRLFVESLGNAVVIKLLRRFSPSVAAEAQQRPGLSRERLRRVTEYVDAHLGDNLTLDAIAAVACLSPCHLSRSFHRAMGVGLHRYVIARRIERAKHLVLTTDLSMAEIGWAVGFESQASFTTRFRREVGRPPSQLRRDG
jgi:AraC-like DNA-binding protein